MSAFKGRQGKGARQRHRDELYYAAVGRQLLNLDRGELRPAASPLSGLPLALTRWTPAPIEKFLRKGDSVDGHLLRTEFNGWIELGAAKGGAR